MILYPRVVPFLNSLAQFLSTDSTQPKHTPFHNERIHSMIGCYRTQPPSVVGILTSDNLIGFHDVILLPDGYGEQCCYRLASLALDRRARLCSVPNYAKLQRSRCLSTAWDCSPARRLQLVGIRSYFSCHACLSTKLYSTLESCQVGSIAFCGKPRRLVVCCSDGIGCNGLAYNGPIIT